MLSNRKLIGSLFLLPLFFIVSCTIKNEKKQQYYKVAGPTQGTYYNVLYGNIEIENLQEAIVVSRIIPSQISVITRDGHIK